MNCVKYELWTVKSELWSVRISLYIFNHFRKLGSVKSELWTVKSLPVFYKKRMNIFVFSDYFDVHEVKQRLLCWIRQKHMAFCWSYGNRGFSSADRVTWRCTKCRHFRLLCVPFHLTPDVVKIFLKLDRMTRNWENNHVNYLNRCMLWSARQVSSQALRS